jgi:hypothetical protein
MPYFDRLDSDLYNSSLNKKEITMLSLLEKDTAHLMEILRKILSGKNTSYQQSLEVEIGRLMTTIDLATSNNLLSKENISKSQQRENR